MQYSEYTKRKLQGMRKYVGTAQLGDASLYIQTKRFQASVPVSGTTVSVSGCCPAVVSTRKSDGQRQEWSSAGVVAAAAGKAICCAAPVTYPIVQPCCPPLPDVGTATPADSYLGIKPEAYYTKPCCRYTTADRAPAKCCPYPPGYHDSLWANNVPAILGPDEIPQTSCHTCAPLPACCDCSC